MFSVDVFVAQIGAIWHHLNYYTAFFQVCFHLFVVIFLCFDYLRNVDILLLLCRLFCRSSVLLEVTTWLLFFPSENNAFSPMCDVCTKPVFWGRNSVRYLYSFWVLFLLCWVKLDNDARYLGTRQNSQTVALTKRIEGLRMPDFLTKWEASVVLFFLVRWWKAVQIASMAFFDKVSRDEWVFKPKQSYGDPLYMCWNFLISTYLKLTLLQASHAGCALYDQPCSALHGSK